MTALRRCSPPSRSRRTVQYAHSKASNDTDFSETDELVVNSANGLLDSLLERPADTHHLADTLHATAQQTTDSAELLQVPARNFHNHVIQAGFEASAGDLRDGVLDLVEWNTKTEFSGNESEWIACCFGRQSRRTR